KREAIESANRADQLCNDTENSLNEFKEKLDQVEADKLREQIASLREIAVKAQAGEEVDPAELKTKTEELQNDSLKVFEKLYKNNENQENNSGDSEPKN
ncbi:hypothetical protein OXX79_009602, partial [Metschnikowia pulcherrima]